jgi:hypothetical protein
VLTAAGGFAAVLGRLEDAPLQPDREQARAWAEQELQRPEYQADRPGLVQQVLNWLLEQLDKVPHPQISSGQLGSAVLAAILIVVFGFLLWRSGGLRRQARAVAEDLFDPAGTAEQHRAAAERAEADGHLAVAVTEWFRAVLLGLSERALIELTPGQTADEAARGAAARLPDLAGELTAAARIFDDVRYGDRPATWAMVASLRELDQRARQARSVAETLLVEPAAVPR